jgi:hypothetical protein
MRDFKNKYGPWALVAGASEGLGGAFAEQLAQLGSQSDSGCTTFRSFTRFECPSSGKIWGANCCSIVGFI